MAAPAVAAAGVTRSISGGKELLMLRCALQRLLLLLGVALGLASARPVRAETLVVAVRSLDAVKASFDYLAPFLGQKEYTTQAAVFLKLVSTGVDPRRPFGFFADWSSKEKELASPIGFVPVARKTVFLLMLRLQGLGPKKLEKDLYRLTLPPELGGIQLFLRFHQATAYVTPNRALLGGRLPDPETLVPAGPPSRLVFARFRVDRIPREARKPLSQDVAKALKEAASRRDQGDSELDYRFGLALAAAMLKQFAGLVEQTKDVLLHLDVEPKRHRLALELAVVPQPNSRLAASSQYLSTTPSRFCSVVRKADLGLGVRLPLPREMAEYFRLMSRYVIEQQVNPAERAATNRAFKAMLPTLTGETLDVSLTGRLLEDSGVALTGGIAVARGRQLEHVIRDMTKDASQTDRALFPVQWSHARHRGARIHRGQPSLPFPIPPLYLAVTDEVLVLGTDLPALKDTLDGIRPAPARGTPFVQGEANLRVLTRAWLLGTVFARDQKRAEASLNRIALGNVKEARALVLEGLDTPVARQLRRRYKQTFAGVDEDRVRLRVTLHGGDALRLRLDLDTPLLKFVPLVMETIGN
jgi:hypothetical protein